MGNVRGSEILGRILEFLVCKIVNDEYFLVRKPGEAACSA